jgi:hypothetical protein
MQNYFNLECLVKICCYGESLVYCLCNEKIISMYRNIILFDLRLRLGQAEKKPIIFNQMFFSTKCWAKHEWVKSFVSFLPS